MDSQEQIDQVFQALANKARRMILDVVKNRPGCSVSDLCEHFQISRIGVMKHLNILVEAHLILSTKKGRTRELYFNAAPIQLIYDRWTDEYSSFWTTQVVDLKKLVESKQKNKKNQQKKKTRGR